MKLNSKISLQFISIIILISLYHYFIHNGLEKTFSQTYFNYDNIKRPLKLCDKEVNCSRLYCTGMPSGHAETAAVFCFLLFFNKIIPLWISLFIIALVSLQRIISNKHTINQVIVGSTLGLLYATIYKKLNLSILSFAIVFSIGFILTLLSIYKIDQQVYGPIPSWVDKSMIPSIKKKQESPFYIKIGSIYINAVIQNRTFITWQQLENYLDIIVERIKNSGKHYDAVVGIKTGGAIISDYISLKLGLPNYKIKLTREEYGCDKKSSDTINDMIKKKIFNKQDGYTICEGINDNLEGKNIILIDECVSTGITMQKANEYLKEQKYVNEIYNTCIAIYKWGYEDLLKINNVLNGTILIWPWGYDN